MVPAGGRRVRHGVELRDPGRAEHTAHAGASGPLSAELAGIYWRHHYTIFIYDNNSLYFNLKYNFKAITPTTALLKGVNFRQETSRKNPTVTCTA